MKHILWVALSLLALGALRARLGEIARDPETARLDRRVKTLHGRLVDSSGRVRDADDVE